MALMSRNGLRPCRSGSASLMALLALTFTLSMVLLMCTVAVSVRLHTARLNRLGRARLLAESAVEYAYWRYRWESFPTLPLPIAENNRPLFDGVVSYSVVDNSTEIAGSIKITTVATVEGTTASVTRVFPAVPREVF